MKEFFQRFLTERHYRMFVSLRRKSARRFQKIGAFLNRGLNLLIPLLPVSSLLHLKSIQVIRKLDYDRKEILLKIDSYENEYLVRLNSCKKEKETIQWIENFMRAGDVFYDIGANVGAYSLVAVKCHGESVRAIAFEPSFLNFAKLCENVRLNSCQASITPLFIALSDATTVHSFRHENWIPGGALHSLTKEPGPDALPVLSYKLDDLIDSFGLPEPNHLKIDVDGLELSVLRGAEKTLTRNDVRSIILEMRKDDSDEQEIMRFLQERGFDIHSKHFHRDGDTGEFTKTYNCIFWRRNAWMNTETPQLPVPNSRIE